MFDVSQNKHHVCNQRAIESWSDEERLKKIRKLWQVLLDSQSTCDVVANKAFLTNIRQCRWTLRLQTQTGEFRITQIGDMKGVGTVWFI